MNYRDPITTESDIMFDDPAAIPTLDVLVTPSSRVRRSSAHQRQRRRWRQVRGSILALLPYLLFLAGLVLVTIGGLSYLEQESPLALFITRRDMVQAQTIQGQTTLSGHPPNEAVLDTASMNQASDWPVLTRDATGRLIVPFFYIGDPFGTIRIPSVDIEVTAFHGDSETEFRQGVGHYAGSFYPGQDGNILIAGHRNSFFRNFEYLEIGDNIEFETTYGRFTYTVTEFKIIKGSDHSIANDTTQEQLTLYTCYPFTFIGHAPERFVVIAELSSAEVNVQ